MGLTTIPYRAYVLKECVRQWADCQEQKYGPWEHQSEEERRKYFEDMYQFLWDSRHEPCGVVVPRHPEKNAWEKLKKPTISGRSEKP